MDDVGLVVPLDGRLHHAGHVADFVRLLLQHLKRSIDCYIIPFLIIRLLDIVNNFVVTIFAGLRDKYHH